MPFGLLTGGPLQMLFGLLLMQGLSLTMWRAFLNQTIPQFNPLRFNLALGNMGTVGTDRNDKSMPMLVPQQQVPVVMQHVPQQQVPVVMQHVPQQQLMTPATVYIVPQLAFPQQQKSSASTHIPVHVDSPSKVMKRMLKHERRKVLVQMNSGFGGNAFRTRETPKKRICYYLLEMEISLEFFDAHLCTHIIIVGFARITRNNTIDTTPRDHSDIITRIMQLKEQNADLKIVLSIEDADFSRIFQTETGKSEFIVSAVEFANRFDFNGIEIQWKFPLNHHFLDILNSLRAESARDTFIVTASVGAPIVSDDIPKISDSVDFLTLISYDYNRSDRVSHHSPLFPNDNQHTLNAAWNMLYWTEKGMKREKLLMGIATFGRTFSLTVPIMNRIDSPIAGSGLNNGLVNYTDVCTFLAQNTTTEEFDAHQRVPFAFNGYDWISYENADSIRAKVEFVRNESFGGISAFALNYDDWSGACGGVPFPLHEIIRTELK